MLFGLSFTAIQICTCQMTLTEKMFCILCILNVLDTETCIIHSFEAVVDLALMSPCV